MEQNFRFVSKKASLEQRARGIFWDFLWFLLKKAVCQKDISGHKFKRFCQSFCPLCTYPFSPHCLPIFTRYHKLLPQGLLVYPFFLDLVVLKSPCFTCISYSVAAKHIIASRYVMQTFIYPLIQWIAESIHSSPTIVPVHLTYFNYFR